MAMQDFRPGVYRHYKGDHYLALGLARADETDEVVVVYTRLYARAGLPMSTRLLRIWNETVDTGAGPQPPLPTWATSRRTRLTRRRAAPGVIHFTSISAAPSPTWSPTA